MDIQLILHWDRDWSLVNIHIAVSVEALVLILILLRVFGYA